MLQWGQQLNLTNLTERLKEQGERLREQGEVLVKEASKHGELLVKEASKAADKLSLDRLQRDSPGGAPHAPPSQEGRVYSSAALTRSRQLYMGSRGDTPTSEAAGNDHECRPKTATFEGPGALSVSPSSAAGVAHGQNHRGNGAAAAYLPEQQPQRTNNTPTSNVDGSKEGRASPVQVLDAWAVQRCRPSSNSPFVPVSTQEAPTRPSQHAPAATEATESPGIWSEQCERREVEQQAETRRPVAFRHLMEEDEDEYDLDSDPILAKMLGKEPPNVTQRPVAPAASSVNGRDVLPSHTVREKDDKVWGIKGASAGGQEVMGLLGALSSGLQQASGLTSSVNSAWTMTSVNLKGAVGKMSQWAAGKARSESDPGGDIEVGVKGSRVSTSATHRRGEEDIVIVRADTLLTEHEKTRLAALRSGGDVRSRLLSLCRLQQLGWYHVCIAVFIVSTMIFYWRFRWLW